MDERLQKISAEGDVDALFSQLKVDPYALERVDQIPFVTTPLHTAAGEGKIHFAKEILNLKPSFAWKRDHLGRSPLHLALEGKRLQEERSPLDSHLKKKYQELVTWLIKHDSELVRVKARGMVTPLHLAAQLDDESSSAYLLYACPSSVEDLTVKSETVVHVALKNGSFKAFKVLLGWLRRFNKEEILESVDEEGNNALHTAVSANQPEAVKLLIRCMKVNKKNDKGLTALDIFYDRQGSLDAAVRDILIAAKAKTASELYCSPIRLQETFIYFLRLLVAYFSAYLHLQRRILNIFGISYRNVAKLPLEVRNVLLVVTVLIATATYQAAISPPGGYWQDDGNPQSAYTTTNIFNDTGPSQQHAGKMILGSVTHLSFIIFNSFAFLASVWIISTLVNGLPFYRINIALISCMVISYYISIFETLSYPKRTFAKVVFIVYLIGSGLVACLIPISVYWQKWQESTFREAFEVRRN